MGQSVDQDDAQRIASGGSDSPVYVLLVAWFHEPLSPVRGIPHGVAVPRREQVQSIGSGLFEGAKSSRIFLKKKQIIKAFGLV